MKKNQIINIFLILALISTTAPLHAQDEIVLEEQIQEVAQEPMQESAPEEAAPKKQNWLKRQFNESVARFKKCWNRECTKTELAKAARDVAVAAGIVITGMYAVGKTTEKGVATAFRKLPEEDKRGWEPTLTRIQAGALKAQRPAQYFKEQAEAFIEKAQELTRLTPEVGAVYKNQEGLLFEVIGVGLLEEGEEDDRH